MENTTVNPAMHFRSVNNIASTLRVVGAGYRSTGNQVECRQQQAADSN